jgi:hypothetical protein
MAAFCVGRSRPPEGGRYAGNFGGRGVPFWEGNGNVKVIIENKKKYGIKV